MVCENKKNKLWGQIAQLRLKIESVMADDFYYGRDLHVKLALTRIGRYNLQARYRFSLISNRLTVDIKLLVVQIMNEKSVLIKRRKICM